MRKFNSPYVYKNTAIQFTIVKFIGVEANLLCGGGYLQFVKKRYAILTGCSHYI